MPNENKPLLLLCVTKAGVEHQLEVGKTYTATEGRYRGGMACYWIEEIAGWFNRLRFAEIGERSANGSTRGS